MSPFSRRRRSSRMSYRYRSSVGELRRADHSSSGSVEEHLDVCACECVSTDQGAQ